MDSFENLIPPLPAGEAAVLDAPSPRPIKIVRDGILAFISAISLTLAMVVVIVIAEMIRGTMSLTSSGPVRPTPGFVMAALLAAELPFAVVALFLRWRYQSTRRAIPSLFEGPTVAAVLRGIPTGLAVGAFGLVNAFLATKLFGEAASDSMKEVMELLSTLRSNRAVVVGLVLAIAVLAPLCEELFFRGAIFTSVRSTEKMRVAAILSSVLFAIAHLNLRMVPYYIVFGLTMCWLTKRTGSLAASIAAHMTVNGLVCLMVLLSPATT
jgi:membrane protease YdiL (CAAX protease family)